MSTFIHPLACVETASGNIGDGTHIWAFAHVMGDVVVGRDCNIGDHSFLEAGVRIGDGVTIKNGVMVWKGVHLAKYVFVGPGVVFTNDLRPRSPRLPILADRGYSEADWLVETFVEEGASLGAGSVVLPGVRIGAYAMVGASSLVSRNVPAYRLALGHPARCVGWVDEFGKRLVADGNTWCEPRSGRIYRIVEDRPRLIS
jgi:acetyltransferase-like isoleucine patch superfamily enzyme